MGRQSNSHILNDGTTDSSPLAIADRAETTVGTPVQINVLANDHDPDGDALQITAFTMPAHGTVAMVAPGTMRYAPQAGFVGIDFFSYTIGDGRADRSTAWVEVRVRAANGAPLAVDDRVTTSRERPVTFSVLANDRDPDGDTLAITAFTFPVNGDLRFNADQTFTYTPGAGFVGEDGFGYTISDGRGGTAQAEVTLVVEWPNQAPVAVDDRATTTQGVPVTIDILANDSDADGDSLRLVALRMPLHGFLTVNPDQSVTYTPSAGHVGVDDFTYTIDDGRGGRNSAIVAIEVTEPRGDIVPWSASLIPYFYPTATYLWYLHDDLSLTTRVDGSDEFIIRRADAGNADLASEAGAEATQPLYLPSTYNGHGATRYDGIDDYLKTTQQNLGNTKFGTTLSEEWTIILVQSVASIGQASFAVGFSTHAYDGSEFGGTAGDAVGFMLRWGTEGATARSPGVYINGSITNTNLSAQDDALNILIARWNGTMAQIWINGGSPVTLSTGSVTATPEIVFGALAVGRRNCTLDEAEAIIIDRAIADEDRQRFEGQLAHKYGRTAALPGDHPYKTTAPTVMI